MSALTRDAAARVGSIPRAGLVLAWGLALLWALAGLSKVFETVARAAERPDSLFLGGGPAGEWAATFPGGLVLAVAAAEVWAAWLIFTGRTAAGLLLGASLLAALFLAVLVWPIPAGASCGCVGGGVDLPGTPVSRLALLAGMHAFAYTASLPGQRRGRGA